MVTRPSRVFAQERVDSVGFREYSARVDSGEFSEGGTRYLIRIGGWLLMIAKIFVCHKDGFVPGDPVIAKGNVKDKTGIGRPNWWLFCWKKKILLHVHLQLATFCDCELFFTMEK